MGQFSRATLMEVLSLFQIKSHTELDMFFFKYGIDEHTQNGSSKDAKLLLAAKYLIDNPEVKGILGGNLAFEVIEEIVTSVINNEYWYNSYTGEFTEHPQLKRLLLRDGFEIRDGVLVRRVDSVSSYIENEDLLKKLLVKYNLKTAIGHYNQAVSAFTRGEWASCNAQLRAFVEDLHLELAKDLNNKEIDSSNNARQALTKEPSKLFYRELNEWKDGDKGVGFMQGFWERLHPEGSHPGLSSESDSVFRLNLVQITMLEILRRYDDIKVGKQLVF